MEPDLLARILNTAAIVAIAGRRINWSRRPQGEALPCVVLHLIDAPRGYRVTGEADLTVSRVQVDCWGSSYGEAKRLARAVDAALSGTRFNQGSTRFAGVLVIDEDDDTMDEPPETYFRTRLDLAVHHTRLS